MTKSEKLSPQIGDTVVCFREESEGWYGINHTGKVLEVLGDPNDPEYIVDGCPFFVWQEEIKEILNV